MWRFEFEVIVQIFACTFACTLAYGKELPSCIEIHELVKDGDAIANLGDFDLSNFG